MVAASIAGLVVVWLLFDTLERLAPERLATRPGTTLVAGATLVAAWGDLAVRTAHIDDALALLAVAAALRWVAMDRATAATVALAFAAAAKPWAVVFVALAAVPSGRRRWSRPAVAAAVAVLTWAPFILVEPATLDARNFEIATDPKSVLRALGVEAAGTPGWVRWAQLLGGVAIVALVVVGRRWAGGLLAGVTWRLLLDPATNRYYTIGFVLGALLIELRARPGQTPWFTIGAAIILELTAVPNGPVGLGQVLRLGCILAAFVAVAMSAPTEDRAATAA